MDSKNKSDLIQAAVVVPYNLSQRTIVLTKRSDLLKYHPGEICFPGGVEDPDDNSLYQTALRELHEELGITADRVVFIKELSVQATIMGTIIHPWLVQIDSLEPLSISQVEVDRLISIPVDLVVDAKNYEDYFIEREGTRFLSCRFKFENDVVWGATAKIMKQLCLHKEVFGDL